MSQNTVNLKAYGLSSNLSMQLIILPHLFLLNLSDCDIKYDCGVDKNKIDSKEIYQFVHVCNSSKFRIFSLFQIIKDKKLFCLLGVFVCLDLVILLIWQLTDPLEPSWMTITVSYSSCIDKKSINLFKLNIILMRSLEINCTV